MTDCCCRVEKEFTGRGKSAGVKKESRTSDTKSLKPLKGREVREKKKIVTD